MAEILIVEDERVVRKGLEALLTGEGHAVRTARDGLDALRKISERRPDLVLLDVMMPNMNGFRACEEIRRADGALPVIFLTARESEADQVRGIGLGADDYISKAAGEAVTLARIRRALEREERFGRVLAERGAQPIRLGRIRVDPDSLSVADAHGEIARLTKTEADILKLLAAARGSYCSADRIVSELRGQGFACTDSMVYSHVSNLRRKLGPAGEMISSGRKAGYCLVR